VTHIHASYAGDAFHANSVATDAAVTVTPTTPPDSTPPSVSFTNPLDGGTVPAGGTVTIRVNASDDDRVADVRFYVAGSLRCTDTTAPYTCTWWPRKQVGANIPLQAVARDPTGNQGSATINVTTA
jgi:hypothetical protein